MSTATQAPSSKIIDRARKLLAMKADGSGATENEAATASAMLAALMEEHGLEMAQIVASGGDGREARRRDRQRRRVLQRASATTRNTGSVRLAARTQSAASARLTRGAPAARRARPSAWISRSVAAAARRRSAGDMLRISRRFWDRRQRRRHWIGSLSDTRVWTFMLKPRADVSWLRHDEPFNKRRDGRLRRSDRLRKLRDRAASFPADVRYDDGYFAADLGGS